MKSRYLIVSLFVALTLMVSACAPQATPTQAPPPTAAPPTQAAPATQASGTQAPTTNSTGASSSYLDQFKTLGVVASTVPANGDVNPYGIVVVGSTTGDLVQGDVLVSNFNNSGNLQGTGTTIVQIAPDGTVKQFAKLSSGNLPGSCPGGVGLTTALSALNSGWVIVGSLPTKDGTSATAKAGCLIVLDSKGHAVETLSGPEIDGPWDMTAVENGTEATLFVTNVLNGTLAASPNVVNKGTVLRINLSIAAGKMPHEDSRLVIASDLPEKTDPAALVIGPTGLGLGSDGTLYVADTVQNRIASIPNALTVTSDAGSETTVMNGGDLNGPLGLTIAPNGDILVANAKDGNLVEITPAGTHVSTRLVDAPIGAGTLFGLAIVPGGQGLYFVDDGINQLALLNK